MCVELKYDIFDVYRCIDNNKINNIYKIEVVYRCDDKISVANYIDSHFVESEIVGLEPKNLILLKVITRVHLDNNATADDLNPINILQKHKKDIINDVLRSLKIYAIKSKASNTHMSKYYQKLLNLLKGE